MSDEIKSAVKEALDEWWNEPVPARTVTGKKKDVPRWKLLQRGHNVILEGMAEKWGRG